MKFYSFLIRSRTLITLIIILAGLIYFERDKIYINHQELVPKEDCSYFQSFMAAEVAMKDLAVEILLKKGCLPTFIQGGHYRPSMRPAPRSFFTYVDRKKRYRNRNWSKDDTYQIFEGWTYYVRDWNVPDGDIYVFENDRVGRLVPCDNFENPILEDFQ